MNKDTKTSDAFNEYVNGIVNEVRNDEAEYSYSYMDKEYADNYLRSMGLI